MLYLAVVAAEDPTAVRFHYVPLSILIIVFLVAVLLLKLLSMPPYKSKSWSGVGGGRTASHQMLWLSLRRMPPCLPPSFPFLPCLLPRTCCFRYYCLPIKHLSSFLPDFLASLLPTFIHCFLPSFHASFLPSSTQFIFVKRSSQSAKALDNQKKFSKIQARKKLCGLCGVAAMD